MPADQRMRDDGAFVAGLAFHPETVGDVPARRQRPHLWGQRLVGGDAAGPQRVVARGRPAHGPQDRCLRRRGQAAGVEMPADAAAVDLMHAGSTTLVNTRIGPNASANATWPAVSSDWSRQTRTPCWKRSVRISARRSGVRSVRRSIPVTSAPSVGDRGRMARSAVAGDMCRVNALVHGRWAWMAGRRTWAGRGPGVEGRRGARRNADGDRNRRGRRRRGGHGHRRSRACRRHA